MIHILTDSGCDLPQNVIDALAITVIPLQITFEDGTVARDGIDVDGDTLYAKMQSCKRLPTTSQPSPEGFMRAYMQAKLDGDEVIAVLLSSQLSGTYQCAQLAAELAEFEDLHLVDSENLSLALGLLVQLAARLRDEGKTAAEIVAILEHAKQHLHVFAVVDNLDYLRKGGRLHPSVALVGGLFGVKPIITVTGGKVLLGGKARGLAGVYLTLFQKIEEAGGICTTEPYYGIYTLSERELAPI
ncbi:MAG: DegV family protein, partial [Faecalibacterium sp.]